MKTLTSLFAILLLCPVVCSGAHYGQPASTLRSPYSQHQYTQVPVYVMPYTGHLPQSLVVPPQVTIRPAKPKRHFIRTADLRQTIPTPSRVSQTEGAVTPHATVSSDDIGDARFPVRQWGCVPLNIERHL